MRPRSMRKSTESGLTFERYTGGMTCRNHGLVQGFAELLDLLRIVAREVRDLNVE